ncbi:MAG: FAD-binding oxidoreductase [Polymorphobacter sp.]
MAAPRNDPSLLDALAAAVGADHLLTDEADRRFHATDVFNTREIPVAVARPGSIGQLQAVVAACAAAGAPVTVRGGGASYTDGYLHSRPGGVTIDTSRLKAITIDEHNAVVTVEAGVTWAELYEALKVRGLRTPFWGPFSGLAATIGGSMSQNSVSHGQGVSAESLLNIDIITGTGDLLSTGSAGSAHGAPFFRHFGPDLAGLFTGDCGALGVKARITLKLIRRREAFAAASFSFANFDAMHEAMRLIAIEAIDDENFGLDATLQQGQIGRQDGVGAKAEIAINVLKAATSFGSGVKSLAKMAISGDRELKAATYAVHYVTDGVDQTEARAKIAAIKRIGAAQGEEIANTVPTVVRGMPFAPLTNTLGPKGERWVPMHTLLPHDRVKSFHRALMAFWADNQAVMDAHGIFTGAMFMAVGASAFIYEPTFYWPDARTIFHDRMVPAAHLAELPAYAPSDAARALVERMKHDVIDLMHAHGGAHLQIGKVYPLLEGRNPASVMLLRAIKAALDPHDILNPGALGL